MNRKNINVREIITNQQADKRARAISGMNRVAIASSLTPSHLLEAPRIERIDAPKITPIYVSETASKAEPVHITLRKETRDVYHPFPADSSEYKGAKQALLELLDKRHATSEERDFAFRRLDEEPQLQHDLLSFSEMAPAVEEEYGLDIPLTERQRDMYQTEGDFGDDESPDYQIPGFTVK
jgi:hypothetical protein